MPRRSSPEILKLSERVFKRIIQMLVAPPGEPPTLIEESAFVDAVLSKKQPHAKPQTKADGEAFVNNLKNGMIEEGYLRRVGTKIGLGAAVRVTRLANGRPDVQVDAGGGRMVLGSQDGPKIMPLDNGRGREGDAREWVPLSDPMGKFPVTFSADPNTPRDPNCPDCSIWHYCEKHRTA